MKQKAVVTRSFGLYLICKHSALGHRVYKSEMNLMGVLYLLVNTVCKLMYKQGYYDSMINMVLTGPQIK